MTAPREAHCIPFREIPRTSKLFAAFLDSFPRVSRYYAHPPTTEGVVSAAREVRLDAGVRKDVVAILREQNARFTSDKKLDAETARALDRLEAGAVAVVTGQQVGLFGGPMFSLYKAVSAIHCADAITRRGIEAVPIFWMATEDHDLAEVDHVLWNTPQQLFVCKVAPPETEVGRSAGQAAFGLDLKEVVDGALRALEGPFAVAIGRVLQESYAPGETYGSAFAKLMSRLLVGRGIIFLDPLDARLSRLAAPLYRRAIEEADTLRNALLRRSKELADAGFHSQVRAARETTLLFRYVDGHRQPVRSKNGRFTAGLASFTREQLLADIEKTPEAFTSNVLLRPVVEDTLLPTAAYIGGPAEIAYMAQAEVVYNQMLGRMPAVLPRASFTIVEPGIARLLAKYGLDVRDVFRGRQRLRTKMERAALPRRLAQCFESDEKRLRRMLKDYEAPLENLDLTLLGALRTTESKMVYQFQKLRGKAGRAENARTGVLDRHERMVRSALCPEGDLQERRLCALPFLAAYGPEFLGKLKQLAKIPAEPEDSCGYCHQIVTL